MRKIPNEIEQLTLNFEGSEFASLFPCDEDLAKSVTACKVISMQDFRRRISLTDSESIEERKRAALLEILEDAKRLSW